MWITEKEMLVFVSSCFRGWKRPRRPPASCVADRLDDPLLIELRDGGEPHGITAVHTRVAPGKRGQAPGPRGFSMELGGGSRAGSQSPFSSNVCDPIVNRCKTSPANEIPRSHTLRGNEGTAYVAWPGGGDLIDFGSAATEAQRLRQISREASSATDRRRDPLEFSWLPYRRTGWERRGPSVSRPDLWRQPDRSRSCGEVLRSTPREKREGPVRRSSTIWGCA